MVSRERLLKEAEALFSKKTLGELAQWYEHTLSGRYQYVVFVVRRSYLLALIMEKITGKKMEDNALTTFLTEGALLLQCEEFARVYRETGRFPSILLCDDILIHGRNINHCIECLEKQLCLLLPEYDEQEIKYALVRSIWIHVYVRSDEQLLLLQRYEANYDCAYKAKASEWHKLSSDISTMILRSDMANAAYIYSQHISEDVFQHLNLGDFVKTRYQNTIQYTRVSYVRTDSDVKAILTLRMIKNTNQEGYRVIPFIFLPNLSREETMNLQEYLLEQMTQVGFTEQDRAYIKQLEKISGKRTFNELLTLILSQAVLQDFSRKNNISETEENSVEEIVKLVRNYNLYGFKETGRFLHRIMKNTFFTVDELERVLTFFISDANKICTVSSARGINDRDKETIKESLEYYFYKQAEEEERAAYELRHQAYKMLVQSSERRVRGCGLVLNHLNEGYGADEMTYSMAYFLQMMDAGVLSVSSFASNRTEVVGFSQFAKAGEQSLLLYPLEMDEYIPMLSYMQRQCEWGNRELQQEIIAYSGSSLCDISQQEIGKILKFVNEIQGIGEKTTDWEENFWTKKQFKEEDGIAEVMAYLNRQYGHLEKYREYVETKN